MAGKPRTFREIIDLWPQKSRMAKQLGASRGQVDDWYRRNSIPSKYWSEIIASAKRFGYELTAEDLLFIQAESGHDSPARRRRDRERATAG